MTFPDAVVFQGDLSDVELADEGAFVVRQTKLNGYISGEAIVMLKHHVSTAFVQNVGGRTFHAKVITGHNDLITRRRNVQSMELN